MSALAPRCFIVNANSKGKKKVSLVDLFTRVIQKAHVVVVVTYLMYIKSPL